MYEDYCSVIENPMDLSTIIERMKANYYMDESRGNSVGAKEIFRRDILLIFQNCRDFNEKGAEIVKSANRLSLEFKKLWIEQGLN